MRWVLTVGSALAIAAGAAIALSAPIQLGSMDHLGRPIACGDALRADNAAAEVADDYNRRLHDSNPDRFMATDYQDQCAALIADKRRHAVIVSAVAAAVFATGGLALVIPRARRVRRSIRPTPSRNIAASIVDVLTNSSGGGATLNEWDRTGGQNLDEVARDMNPDASTERCSVTLHGENRELGAAPLTTSMTVVAAEAGTTFSASRSSHSEIPNATRGTCVPGLTVPDG